MSKRRLKKDEPFFDDCPLCQAMKKMGIKQNPVDDGEGVSYVTRLHPKQAEALKNAFRDTAERGYPAGGEWVNQD